MLFIIIVVVIWFFALRKQGYSFSLESMALLFPLTGLAIIYIPFAKFGKQAAGIIGIILATAAFCFVAIKFDDFLRSVNLPTDDIVYVPVFGGFSILYFAINLYLGIKHTKLTNKLQADLYAAEAALLNQASETTYSNDDSLPFK